MIRIAIFASGSGSNAQNIIETFKNHAQLEVVAVFTNNPDAGVIKRAHSLETPCVVFSNHNMQDNVVIDTLQTLNIDWIILAGFLRLIPKKMIELYPNKIINVHPALLPKYGGKGMWGHHVHEAVVANKETETGISIHFVNEHYDEGNIIFQVKCKVQASDTAEDVAQKIHLLEYMNFPKIIEQTILRS